MLVEFLLQNAILCSMVAILGGATIYLWVVVVDKIMLDPDGAIAAMNFDNALPVDIRSREDFAKGHIPGAQHIDPDKAAAKVPTLAKKKLVLLIDARGNIAADLARKLRKAGTTNSLVLKGGMAAWQQDGKPITSK